MIATRRAMHLICEICLALGVAVLIEWLGLSNYVWSVLGVFYLGGQIKERPTITPFIKNK